MFEERGDNPYPATFEILYSDSTKVPTIQYNLEHINGIYKVNCRADWAQNIENIKNGIIFIFIWFLIILFVVSVFVIINTIKLAVFARRQEINIMRYVGATNWFIVLPFIFEGSIIGIIASAAAYFIQWNLYIYIYKIIAKTSSLIHMMAFSEVQFLILAGFALIGILTGIIGSCLSLSKYLKA
jgi:cell division transport system permease protein